MKSSPVAAVLVSLLAPLLVTVTQAPAQAAPDDDWVGSHSVQPSAYDWLDDYTPDYDYEIVTVRGLSVYQVLRTLGTVKREIRELTPAQAERWTSNRTRRDYTAPRLALVERRGPSVVVYLPYWVQHSRMVARLSRRHVAAHFTTTVELDTYVTIAREGRIVRQFDAGFRPPRRGALPAERGLDWGARDQNIWATAWAFNERVSRIHISQEWFEGTHRAYVFEGRGP